MMAFLQARASPRTCISARELRRHLGRSRRFRTVACFSRFAPCRCLSDVRRRRCPQSYASELEDAAGTAAALPRANTCSALQCAPSCQCPRCFAVRLLPASALAAACLTGKRLPDRDPLSRGPPARPGAPDPELQAKMALLQQTLDRRDTAVKNTLEKMVCRLPCPRMRIPLREGLVNIIKYYYSGSWRDCGGASANGPLGATSCHGGT